MRFKKGKWWSTASPMKVAAQVPELRCFSLNVNGINRPSKRDQLSAMRKLHDWGVMLLSDTKVHDEREFVKVDHYFGCKQSVWSVGSPYVRCCTIMFFKTITILKKFSDPLGNFIRADVSWEGEKISFISVYAPTDDAKRKKFFSETLKKHLSKHPPLEKLFIAGDFNFVECPFLDRSYQNNRGTAGCQQWHKLFQDLAISSCDLFRYFHSDKKSYTFYSASHKLHSCLDRCYASSPAMPLANNCKHVPLHRLSLTTLQVLASLYVQSTLLCVVPHTGN